MAIRFYSTKGPHGSFSNFSSHPFVLDGLRWPTSEHFFQAEKFLDQAYRERIRLASSPGAAAKLGRSRDMPLREGWEGMKDDVMRRAVRAKFAAHPDITAVLLGTADEHLIEDTSTDHYWGCGTSGSGRNMLGLILMELRQTLRVVAVG